MDKWILFFILLITSSLGYTAEPQPQAASEQALFKASEQVVADRDGHGRHWRGGDRHYRHHRYYRHNYYPRYWYGDYDLYRYYPYYYNGYYPYYYNGYYYYDYYAPSGAVFYFSI